MKPRAESAAEPGWQWRWSRRRRGSTRPRPWDLEEIRCLRALVEQNCPWAQIAIALNRSCSSVQRRAREHGLVRGAAD